MKKLDYHSWAMLEFSSWLGDAPDIYRFPVVHMLKTHFMLEYLWLSGASLGLLENSNVACLSPI